MKHSEPALLFGFIPCVSILIMGSGFVLGVWGAIFEYLFCGLLIWIIASFGTDFIKTLVFWWFSIVFDKPEWLDKPE